MKRGSSLIQYAIILALISIAVIAVYSLLGSTINSFFNKYAASFNNMSNNATNNALSNLIVSGNLAPGALKGTENNPVKQCVGNTCSIDFGSYVLNGIPDNFGEFVKSNSTSGGGDKLVSIIEQLADQLEKEGNTAGAQEFRDLANIGHFMADIQKNAEDKATYCNSQADVIDCLKNFVNSPIGNIAPSNVSKLLPDLDPNMSNFTLLTTSLQSIAYQKKNYNVDVYDLGYAISPTNSLGYAMLDQIDKIKSDTSISQEKRNIANELLTQIDALNQQFSCVNLASLKYVTQVGETIELPSHQTYYDPIQGKEVTVDSTISYTFNGVDDLLHPQTSTGTDLDSAIICVTGQNADQNSACK